MSRIESIDRAGIYRLMHAQARNCDLWIADWQQVKNVPSPTLALMAPHLRNVSLAIGKLWGLYGLLINMNGMDEDMPEEIIQLMQKYSVVWDQL